MNKVYVMLADGFEESEAIVPVDLLRRAGVDVILVSMNETANVLGSHGISIVADEIFAQCDWDQASLLMLPGGKVGTENLERHAGLRELLLSAEEKGIELAAICAAPRVLGRLGLLRGKPACCYPGNEDQLLGAQVMYEPVATAESVITSRGMGTAFAFGLALVRRLCGEETAARIARQTVYDA